MSNIMSGKELASQIEEEVKNLAKGCIIRPSVALINIGNNSISERFIKEKEEACNRVGIYFRYHQFEEDTPELTIINKIKELNNDDYVNGIVINLPIPDRYNEKRLLNTVINSKDIDGLTDINIGRLIGGRKSITSCTAQGIIELLKKYEVEIESKNIVIIGNGRLVGKPLTNMLLNEGATVTVCHSRTEDIKKHTLNADIVISATGIKHLITEDMIKEGTVVIDTGCIVEDGKVYGNVDFDRVSKKASLITPQVGGIGPVTIAMFLRNVILCYNNKK